LEGRDVASPDAAHAAVQELRAKRVDGIILGCTEIPLLLRDDAEAQDLLNPAQFLAEAAVRAAIST
jgi:aspartate/glutamate racemase